MKAGILGVPDELSLGRVESDRQTKERYGQEFHTVLNVQRVQDLSGDTKFVEGTALKEEPEDRYVAEVETDDEDDVGKIRVRERTRKNQIWADFVAVEARNGHQGFVAVSSSDAEFVFDVVGRLSEGPSVRIERGEVDLGAFLQGKDDFNIQTGGGTASGNADTAMAWGSKLDKDEHVGDIVKSNLDAGTSPQIAGKYVYDGWQVHCNIAKSGWAEVWDPDWDTFDYLTWLEKEVIPHVHIGGGD